MKKCALLICLACSVSSCTTSKWELGRVASPDGKCTAVLTTREKTGVPLPGPEPPPTKAKWVRLIVSQNGEKVFDSKFEEIGIFESLGHGFDLAWSPHSSRLAYRFLNTIRIIDMDGNIRSFDIVKDDNALVSSFKWLSNDQLLVVSKGIDLPLDMYGYPIEYHGYLAKSTYVKVTRVHLDSGVSERFKTSVNHPTFMFRSVGFENQEISPYSSRVAFSDGVSVNVYDDSKQKVIARAPVTGPIEGTWWPDDNTVILGLGLLSEGQRRFATFDVQESTIKDATDRLLPLWDGFWSDANWFRMPKK